VAPELDAADMNQAAEKGSSMGQLAGETACAPTKDQRFVEHGGADVQPA